jgi:broad specificity phosphatase PhoE
MAQVVLCSPLTRALQTCRVAFGGRQPAVPVRVHPLLRERLLLSSEVGRRREELEAEFPE